MNKAIQRNISPNAAEKKSYIHDITPATILQLMRTEQKDCTLKLTSAYQSGYLYIRQGELIDDEWDGPGCEFLRKV